MDVTLRDPRGGPRSQLSPASRAEALTRMRSETFDLVVVGGGVVGCGVALDAATRGLSVALVEARDLASGTSSRSSKLIHGGLRYLEQLDFRLVREALHERALLLDTLAPHLVKPLQFVFPVTHRGWERAYVGAGLVLYDTLGHTRGPAGVPKHRQLSKRKALQLWPGLRPDALTGAVAYYDAQVDDARHTMTLARTAAVYGAAIATSTRVTGLGRRGSRVTGVQVRDLESGDEFGVQAARVVAATGVWTDDLKDMLGEESGGLRVRASKGVHIVVPRDRIYAQCGLILRTGTSVLFVIPWGAHWVIGTTDTDWELDRGHPAASSRDVAYLLQHVNRVLVHPLTHEDIQGVYAGLRPLLAGESDATSKLSREHAVVSPAPGLVMIAGGKYTTYRVMAADAVDAAFADLGQDVPPSRTDQVPLLGADMYVAAHAARHRVAAESGLSAVAVEHLLGRYGSLVGDLLDLVAADPALGEPIPGAEEYLMAEALYGATAEGALHLDDLLTRRTRISIEAWDRGLAAAEPVARAVAPVLGWDEEDVDREVEHYLLRVAAERESQSMPDDDTADAARLGAPDVRAATAGAVATIDLEFALNEEDV